MMNLFECRDESISSILYPHIFFIRVSISVAPILSKLDFFLDLTMASTIKLLILGIVLVHVAQAEI
jgi:hypothetical protein